MTGAQIIDALSPVFSTFCDVTAINWQPYIDVLSDVNPGDLDEALQAVQRDHGYHNSPLPKFVADRVDDSKRKRISASITSDRQPHIDRNEGELKTITIKGIGTLKLRVLPDDHPSLQRFCCLLCKDTGWSEVPADPGAQMTVRRCDCWRINPEIQKERERSARYAKERNER